jgi:hypothetical protein
MGLLGKIGDFSTFLTFSDVAIIFIKIYSWVGK